jgi:hypothetical protein
MTRTDTRDFSPAAHIVTLLALLALSAYVAIVNFWFVYDDALITYRIARNSPWDRGSSTTSASGISARPRRCTGFCSAFLAG